MPDESKADPAATDPFWAPVRRRHPDVDIVLLPPERAADEPTEQPSDQAPDQPLADPELLSRLWATAVGGDWPTETAERRTQGRLEITWTREGGEPVAPDTAQAVVRRAAEALREAGWHVLAPAEGLPRVQAGRPDGPDRAELLLLVVPETGRVVLRHRSGSEAAER
ncbi:hypothetical protein QWJ41_20495 [Nocardioides sp. SOB44]|uniref:Uncharacterized protein n=1 Tax=Nocardioides cremeus TaxID=3058044 RepID=A0ABT8TVX4_9ACTN|nr:hypothetical protein [Nocardioides cremeus]MDO3398112.1 hypothetical protein [Nocardioides cremeus]